MDASGASSSTAADPINSSSFGVFINHRGPDTKKTFASYLYRRLLIHGFKPFLDKQELEEGSNFPSQIRGAIRSACVHLAIFSPTYAYSQWCLDELVLMLESKAPIIPIFYNVDPTNLRWTDQKEKGVYAEGLHTLQMKKTVDPRTHEEKPRYDSATLQKWRKALSDVADISGFDLKGKFNGDEGLLLDEVVKRVVKIIAKKTQLYVAKNPTGLNDKVADFETTVLRQQNIGEVQVVGIVGLGGVGKTTLAKEFFNRKRSEYSKSYFLSDVRENARISLHSLQSKLLKGLFYLDRQIDDIHQGTELLRQNLSSKIFLILDDIDHVNQVDALLPNRNGLHKDTLILITSRDEGVLARSGVKESYMYKLTGLPKQHSQELFCLYAFCQPCPDPGFDDLVNKFLMACDGLPLSLIVFGALLSGNHVKSDWEAILYRLKLPNDIKNRLKISYDALSTEEQLIFLDIACVFIGKNKSSVITVWNRSGWEGSLGFKNLQLKCLAKVDDHDVIHMHDHLRDLGREIAENELPRRLWCPTGNINDWLHKKSSVIMEARGIRMQGDSMERLETRDSSELLETRSQMLAWYQWWSQQLLGNFLMELCNSLYNIHYCFLDFDVSNLQLVETEGNMLDRILRVRSPNLLWLSWRSCPYKYLPSWITLKNLRVLRVEGGELETLWQGKSQAPLQLQELDIIDARCLSSIPKSIGQLKHLERILIDSLSLAKLPEEFGDLNSLKALVLHAHTLKSLPNSLGKLRNLHSLDLSGCEKLERLPDSFGSLSKLHSFDLNLCSQLQRLPDSFGSLSNLHSLDLSGCKILERLPDSFGSLSNLRSLRLFHCFQLERLPDSFGSLSNLHRLHLSCCGMLERLPDSFGSLSNLHSLNLTLCSQLERLPDSFSSLSNLHSLVMRYCKKLERLPDSFGSLSNLHRLDMFACEKLERLPDSFGSLGSLGYFVVFGAINLRISSETFGNIRTLQHIDLSYCKVEVWPWQLGHQRSLKVLKLKGTNFMEELPRAFDLPSDLEVLWIGNPLLDTVIPSLGDLRNLKDLHLEFRWELKCLSASVERSSELSWLKVAGCPIIHTSEVFYDNVVYPKLSELIIEECINLTEVGTLPKALRSVTLDRCYNLRSIEGLSGLPKLQEVRLIRCDNLRSIEGLSGLPKLQKVRLIRCDNLRSIEGLSGLPMIHNVELIGCDNLRSIEGLCGLPKLQLVYIQGCNELQVPSSVEERLKVNGVTVIRG